MWSWVRLCTCSEPVSVSEALDLKPAREQITDVFDDI